MVCTLAIALGGCKSRPFVYFDLTPDTRDRRREKDNIAVHLRLSSENSVDNKLKVVNKGKKSVTLMPKKVYLTIKDNGTVIPVNARYYKLINRREKRALALCREATLSYSCADMVNDFYRGRNREGFRFGTIDSRSHTEGYITFNLPDALTGQAVVKEYEDVFKAGKSNYNGVITIQIDTRGKPVTFEFPVALKVFFNIDEVPRIKKQF